MKKLAEWASEHGQTAKIRRSDGCGGKTIPMAVQPLYDCHGFEVYLGISVMVTGDPVGRAGLARKL